MSIPPVPSDAVRVDITLADGQVVTVTPAVFTSWLDHEDQLCISVKAHYAHLVGGKPPLPALTIRQALAGRR